MRRRTLGETVEFDYETRRQIDVEIKRVCQTKNWTVQALNVRTTHVHLVITTHNDEPGSLLVQRIKGAVTKYLYERNTYARTQKIWAEGFYIRTVKTPGYFGRVLSYVFDEQ